MPGLVWRCSFTPRMLKRKNTSHAACNGGLKEELINDELANNRTRERLLVKRLFLMWNRSQAGTSTLTFLSCLSIRVCRPKRK